MSAEVDIYNNKYIEEMNRVVELKLQGMQPHEIMKETGLQRKVVVAHIEDWKRTAAASAVLQDRALDALNSMDAHFDMLIKKTWETMGQVEDDLTIHGTTPQRIQQKLNAIKTVAELDAKRLDALQKAGLLEGADMGDQVAAMEEKQAKLVAILRNDLCPACKKVVGVKLQEITKQTESIVIYDA